MAFVSNLRAGLNGHRNGATDRHQGPQSVRVNDIWRPGSIWTPIGLGTTNRSCARLARSLIAKDPQTLKPRRCRPQGNDRFGADWLQKVKVRYGWGGPRPCQAIDKASRVCARDQTRN